MDKHEKFVEDLKMSPDRLMSVPFELYSTLTAREVGVLSYLLNKHWHHKWGRVLYQKGWFYCRMTDMQRTLGISPRCQQYVLEKLIERGLVYRKLVGMPRKRYFKINCQRVEALLKTARRGSNSP